MKKILCINFIVTYIFISLLISSFSVSYGDTFNDDFIKNKKLETSIDLKNNTKSSEVESFKTDKTLSDETQKSKVSSNPSTSENPISGNDKNFIKELSTSDSQDELTQSTQEPAGPPKPLYNKKSALKTDDFYDNLSFDTTAKVPAQGQNNLFIIGLFSIVLSVTLGFLVVNFLRVRKDIDRQREIFRNNIDPSNIKSGFLSADYDLRNAKDDGIEIVKNNQEKNNEELSSDIVEETDELSSDIIPENNEESQFKEDTVQSDDLSYQLKEANKVFEKFEIKDASSNENVISPSIEEGNEDSSEENFISEEDLDYIESMNSDLSENIEDSNSYNDEISQEDVIPIQQEEVVNKTETVSEEDESVIESFDEPSQEILITDEVQKKEIYEEEQISEEILADENSEEFIEEDNSYLQEVEDEYSASYDKGNIISDEDEISEDEIFISEDIQPQEEIISEESLSSKDELVEEPSETFEEDSLAVQDVIIDTQVEEAENNISKEPSDNMLVASEEVTEIQESEVETQENNSSEGEDNKTEQIPYYLQKNKTEEIQDIKTPKFEVVEEHIIDDDKKILLIKEGNKYSFISDINSTISNLIELESPEKISRIKEIDEKHDNKQVYMLKTEKRRILFAMDEKEADFIMEL